MTIKNDSRHCQMSSEGQNRFQLRSTDLDLDSKFLAEVKLKFKKEGQSLYPKDSHKINAIGGTEIII